MTDNTGPMAISLRIRGRVQGVWYRGWMVDEARGRGLGGWVRNRRDGSVEALIVGPEQALREMIASCYHGPRAARVEDIQQTPIDDSGVGELDQPGFRQRRTE